MSVYIYLFLFLMVTASCCLIQQQRNRILGFKGHKVTDFYLAFIFLCFGFMVTMRHEIVGNDTMTYVGLFEEIAGTSYFDASDYLSRYEIGYIYLNWFISLITDHPQAILIITGFFTTFSFYYFIKTYSKSVYLSVLLFVFLGFLDSSMNAVRANIALGILLFSYRYIEERNLWKFSGLVFLAFLFHKTSIFFFPAWFVTAFKLNKKNIIFFLTITILFSLFFSTIFARVLQIFTVYQYYDGGDYMGETRLASVMQTLLFFCFFLLALFVRNQVGKKKFKEGHHDRMANLLFVGICIMIISFNFNLIGRIASFYTIFVVTLAPNVLALLKNKSLRMIIKTMIFVGLTSYYLIIFIFRPEWNRIFPYLTFWQGHLW